MNRVQMPLHSVDELGVVRSKNGRVVSKIDNHNCQCWKVNDGTRKLSVLLSINKNKLYYLVISLQ